MSECINCHKMDGAVCQKCWSENRADNIKLRAKNERLKNLNNEFAKDACDYYKTVREYEKKDTRLRDLNRRLVDGLEDITKWINMPRARDQLLSSRLRNMMAIFDLRCLGKKINNLTIEANEAMK